MRGRRDAWGGHVFTEVLAPSAKNSSTPWAERRSSKWGRKSTVPSVYFFLCSLFTQEKELFHFSSHLTWINWWELFLTRWALFMSLSKFSFLFYIMICPWSSFKASLTSPFLFPLSFSSIFLPLLLAAVLPSHHLPDYFSYSLCHSLHFLFVFSLDRFSLCLDSLLMKTVKSCKGKINSCGYFDSEEVEHFLHQTPHFTVEAESTSLSDTIQTEKISCAQCRLSRANFRHCLSWTNKVILNS